MRFIRDLDSPLIWAAVCTIAVEAGYQAAKHRKVRRERKLQVINIICRHLGLQEIQITPGLLEYNLRYGYGGHSHYEELGVPADLLYIVGASHSNGQSELLKTVDTLRSVGELEKKRGPQRIQLSRRKSIQPLHELPQAFRDGLSTVLAALN